MIAAELVQITTPVQLLIPLVPAEAVEPALRELWGQLPAPAADSGFSAAQMQILADDNKLQMMPQPAALQLVHGREQTIAAALERAGRVADFLEFAEIMIRDALARGESCGCHLREESQTEENEAKRDDANYSYVSVWGFAGEDKEPDMFKEPLTFEEVTPSQRSYK